MTSSFDRTIKIWDANDGSQQISIKDPRGIKFSAAFSSDGKYIVTGGAYRTASILDVETGKELINLRGHSHSIMSVTFSPDGKRVITGSEDNTAKIWNIKIMEGKSTTARSSDVTYGRKLMGKEIYSLIGHSAGISSVTFSPDGKHIVTGSKDGTAKIWDVNTRRFSTRGIGDLKVFNSEWKRGKISNDKKTCEFHSPHGKINIVEIDSNCKRINICNAGKKKIILKLKGCSGTISSLAFSPNGKLMIIGNEQSVVKIWDIVTGKEIVTLKGHSDRIWSVAFSPDGKRIITASEDRTAKIWDAENGRELISLKPNPDSFSRRVYSAHFSLAGKQIITNSVRKRIWDTIDWETVSTPEELQKYRLTQYQEWLKQQEKLKNNNH